MGFPWKAIIRIAAPIGAGAIGGPAGATLAGGIISKMLPEKERDQFEDWAKLAEKLEDNEELTNDERGDKLRAKIRWDLFQATADEPAERRVNWLMDTVVMSINGEFEN